MLVLAQTITPSAQGIIPCIVEVVPVGNVALAPPYFENPFILLYPPSTDISKFCSSIAEPGVLNKSI